MKKVKRTKKNDDWIRAKYLRNDCLTRVCQAKLDFIDFFFLKQFYLYWKTFSDLGLFYGASVVLSGPDLSIAYA